MLYKKGNKDMTRQEYNESVGITKMFDAGDLSLPVDDVWIEFIQIILDCGKDKEEKCK